MKHLVLSTTVLAALASPLLAQSTTGSYQDQYGVLSERNMFMRDRPRPRPPRENRVTNRPDTTSPQAIERATVLRGVAIEDNELHAYLENSRTGQRFRVAPGDKLASGIVDEIAIDAIAYEANGRTVWIEIGQNLSGTRAETTSGSSRFSRPFSSGSPGSGNGSGNATNNANSAEQPGGTVVTTEDGTVVVEPPHAEESATPSPSASSLEERMKQRRLQQRGGGK